jgi:hypothetical protein
MLCLDAVLETDYLRDCRRLLRIHLSQAEEPLLQVMSVAYQKVCRTSREVDRTALDRECKTGCPVVLDGRARGCDLSS